MRTEFVYPNLIKFLLLSFILVVPFLLRFINTKLEVYPAVLFPSGASIISTEDSLLIFDKFELLGIDSISGTRKKLDPEKFVHPIPKHYWTRMVPYRFGLDSVQQREISIRRLQIKVQDSLFFSAAQVEQTQIWFQTKLQEQACLDSFFYITSLQVFFNQSEKKIDSSIVVNETIVRLY